MKKIHEVTLKAALVGFFLSAAIFTVIRLLTFLSRHGLEDLETAVFLAGFDGLCNCLNPLFAAGFAAFAYGSTRVRGPDDE